MHKQPYLHVMSDLTNANLLCAVGRRSEQYMKDNLPENKVLFLAPTSKESDPQPAKRSVMFSSSPVKVVPPKHQWEGTKYVKP